MTELEKEINILTKDVAVVVNIQKNMQMSQARTTENIDKLTENISRLSHDTIYLKNLEDRVEDLEESSKWNGRKIITMLLGILGSIIWFIFGKDVV